MSIYGYYGVARKSVGAEELFRTLCAEQGVADVSLNLTPRDLTDVDAAADAFDLHEGFTQVSCTAPIQDASADLAARLAALPPLAGPEDEMHHLSLRYEATEETLDVWRATGSSRRTRVAVMRAVGLDLLRPALALAVDLDYSKASRVKDAEQHAIQAWWRGVHHAFLDDRLGLLGVHARFDLDFNEPRLLAASAPELSITRDWGHLSDPVVLLAAPLVDLAARASQALRAFPADRLVVVFQGPARALAPLRAWLPPVQHVSGPAIFDPVPLATLRLPPRFTGEACLRADLPCDDEVSADLTLWLGATPRLNLTIRSGLTPTQKRRLESTLHVKLTFEGAD